MAPLGVALHADPLVAFLHELDQALLGNGRAVDGLSVEDLLNDAVERNLTTGELTVPPEFDPLEPAVDQKGGYAYQLHQWAYALTGASAKARRAVSQLGDGEMPGMGGVGRDQISELVAHVADRMAAETAAAEKA